MSIYFCKICGYLVAAPLVNEWGNKFFNKDKDKDKKIKKIKKSNKIKY